MLPSRSMVPLTELPFRGLLCRPKRRGVDRSKANEKYKSKVIKEFVILKVLIFSPRLEDDT